MPEAQYMLGLFYQQGTGVLGDLKLAAYWYEKAGEQGMDNAQLLLGTMYAQGQGIPRDAKQAYAWLNLASTSSNAQIRDTALKGRDEVAKTMTSADISSANMLSQSLYSKYAK
jgi:TPR repeat protein